MFFYQRDQLISFRKIDLFTSKHINTIYIINMNNPLYLNTNVIMAIDPYTNEEVQVSILDIGKYFKNVYCLCPFTTIDYESLNRNILEEDEYNDMIRRMILYRSNISIVKNLIHYGNLLYTERKNIIGANHLNYTIDSDMVLVLPFFNISFLNLQKYIDSINNMNNVDNLYNMIILNNYFGESDNKMKTKLYLNNIIKTLDSSDYWKIYNNCRCNLTKLFDIRNFNFNKIKSSKDDIVNNVIGMLDKTKLKENYLDGIFKTKNYVDPSSVLIRNGYRLYNRVIGCKYNNDDIINLFLKLDSYQRFILYCAMIMSKEYCHLVINNSMMLELMKNEINENIEIFEYLFGYAWIRFYFEECITKYNMKTSDSFIFDINTASLLPVFHFDYMNPHLNPYMPILVGNHSLNPSCNIGGVKLNNKIIHRICNLEEFKKRLNIFISNKMDRNILEGIDFKENKMAITGSIMTACLQYYHPLLDLYVTPNISIDDLYNRFFNEYYCDADVDIMIRTYNNIEFLDIVKKIHEKITHNILATYVYSEAQHVAMNVNKIICLFVTEDFIKTNLPSVSAEITSNLNHPSVIKTLLPLINKLHLTKLDDTLKDYDKETIDELKQKHPYYFDFSEKNIIIKLYNKRFNTTLHIKTESEYTDEELEKLLESNEDVEMITHNIHDINTEGISLTFSFKVRIVAPQLDHDFELFPIMKNDFMETVSRFHMPCVRAYYDNTNVYMTPSCISAHLTYMNIDYKYFAGSKDPIEIINKYRMRGFGTWLNKNEIATYLKYTSMVPFWNNLFNIDLNKKNTLATALGPLTLTHKLFYPRQFNMDHFSNPKTKPIPFDDPYVTVTLENTFTRNEYMKKIYNTKCTSLDIMSKYTSNGYINSTTGYINTIPINIIDFISTTYEHKNNKPSDENITL